MENNIEATVRALQERVALLEKQSGMKTPRSQGKESTRTAITNETLSAVKADLETVLNTIQAILDGSTITNACYTNGISYEKFQRTLNYARLPHNEKYSKSAVRLDAKEFSTWEERLYADALNVPLGSKELACSMPDDAEETVQAVLKMLPDRERNAIESVYERGETLEQAGCILGVTRERARQIALRGIRMIGFKYGNEMKCGAAAVKQAEQIFLRKKEEMIAGLVETRKSSDVEYIVAERERGLTTEGRAHSIKISDMNLSMRAYNVLRQNGKGTLEDILAIKDVYELQHMRNAGAKVVDEILNAVHKFGYTMLWERRATEE